MEIGIAAVGFVIGTLVGLTGVGGGSLTTPLLILFVGVRPLMAVGTDLVYAAVTKIFGAWQHGVQQNIDYRIAFFMAIGSVPASLAGVGLLSILKQIPGLDVDGIVTRALGGVLILVAADIVLKQLGVIKVGDNKSSNGEPLRNRRFYITVVALGAGIGFLVGLTSVGSGTLAAVALISFKLPITRVVGTDVFHATLLLGAAGGAHFWVGNVDLALAVNLLLGSVPGVIIGSRLTSWMPAPAVRTLLASLLLVAGLKMI